MFDRITFDSRILRGRACIRGTRIPVSVIVGQIAHGASHAEILKDYPDLEPADLRQVMEYAAWLTREETHPASELRAPADESRLLARISVNPDIFGGKPIIRGRRLAVEHVLGMLAAGDSMEEMLENYPWLDQADIRACLVYARRVIGHERIEPLRIETGG